MKFSSYFGEKRMFHIVDPKEIKEGKLTSFGTYPGRRPYENMFLSNFLITIFRYCPYFNQDMSPSEIGKRI